MIATVLQDLGARYGMGAILPLLLALVLSAGWAASAWLVRLRHAAVEEGWAAYGAPEHRWLLAGAVLALPLAAALAAGTLLLRPPPPPVAAAAGGRDFALIEREFTYRDHMYDQMMTRVRQGHQQELATLRRQYESEIAALRAAYERAIETLPSNIERLVRRIGEQFGFNPDFFARICAIESGFNPTIANGDSGARGLFQFMPDTWNTVGAQHSAELAAMGLNFVPVTSANRSQADDPRNNARLNAVMGGFLTRASLEQLNTNDPAILYISHFAGPVMAAYVRDNHATNPDRLIRDVLREVFPTFADAIIAQNAPAYTETTTVQDFYNWAAGHFRGITTARLETPAGSTPGAAPAAPAPGAPAGPAGPSPTRTP